MSDKYSEEAFNALYEAINFGDANDRDRNLVSQEQVVQILEALDKEGFCIRKKSLALGDFCREEIVDEQPIHAIPFVIRPVEFPVELDSVTVRREETHGGANYYAYYRQPNLGTAERVKAVFDKELGCTDKTKVVVLSRTFSKPASVTLSELPNISAWTVNPLPPFGKTRPPTFMVDDKFNAAVHRMMIDEEINSPTYPHQEKLLDQKVTSTPPPDLKYDIGTREFKISLSGDGHQQYSVEVKTSHITFVSKSSYLDLLTAVKSVIEGVCSEGKDDVETRRLILSNITELFKGNPNFQGVEFADTLEA